MPTITSALYVRNYFDKDSKNNALKLVRYIKQEFKYILENIDWMDEKTRQSALEKANTIEDHIGYPDELLDDQLLEKTFESVRNHPTEMYKTIYHRHFILQLEVDENQYLQSMLNISLLRKSFLFERLRQTVNKSDWLEHDNSMQVNAFYHPVENSISTYRMNI